MDFIDKKEKFADILETYIQTHENTNELLSYINELSNDHDFKGKDLFNNIFRELDAYLSELTNKELKQRVMMIRSFME